MLEKENVGSIWLQSPVCLTDPSYDEDVWCRINGIPVVPGEYQCIAWVSDHARWGRRVARLGVYLNGAIPNPREFEKIPGEVGVDSGLAGVYDRKPDFTREEWIEFCDSNDRSKELAWIHNGEFDTNLNGFTTSSGFGDGGYTAYRKVNREGEATAIEILFY